VRKLVVAVVAGVLLMAGAASAQSVEDRQYHLQRRIAEAIEHNRISPRDASRLERDMDKVARHIAEERHEHHGRLSQHDWEKLNREMDKVENRLRDAQRYSRYEDRRERRYERDGFYDRDGRPW
jgi:septal ring factor EnvC (AmiA/AmiB activator)